VALNLPVMLPPGSTFHWNCVGYQNCRPTNTSVGSVDNAASGTKENVKFPDVVLKKVWVGVPATRRAKVRACGYGVRRTNAKSRLSMPTATHQCLGFKVRFRRVGAGGEAPVGPPCLRQYHMSVTLAAHAHASMPCSTQAGHLAELRPASSWQGRAPATVPIAIAHPPR